MIQSALSSSFVLLSLLLCGTAMTTVVVAQNVTSGSTTSTTAPPPTTTSNGLPASSVFSIRSNPFPNGNNAMTYGDLRIQLQSSLQKYLNPNNATPPVMIDYNATTAMELCDVEEQLCNMFLTFYFVGATPAMYTSMLNAKVATDVIKALQVDGYAPGPSVPPKPFEEPTITAFIVTLVLGYFVGSAVVTAVLCVIKCRIIAAGESER